MTSAMVAIAGRQYVPAVVGYITVSFDDDKDPLIGFSSSGMTYEQFLADAKRWLNHLALRLRRQHHRVTERDRVVRAQVCCQMNGDTLCLPSIFEGNFKAVIQKIGLQLDELIRELYIRPAAQATVQEAAVDVRHIQQLTFLHMLRHALVRVTTSGRRRPKI